MSFNKQPKTFLSLPPDILTHILSFLPLPNIPNVAKVSRRMKILINNDAVYEPKLKLITVNTDMMDNNQAGLTPSDDASIDQLSNKFKMLPGGHMLPGSSRYWETFSAIESANQAAANAAFTMTDDPFSPSVGAYKEKSTSNDVNGDKNTIENSIDINTELPSPATITSPTSNGRAATPTSANERERSISAQLPGVKKSAIVIGAGGLAASKKTKNQLLKQKIQAGIPSPIPNGLDASLPNACKPKTKPKKEIFKHIIIELKAFYFDFRKRQKDSKLFRDYKDITEIATILHRLKLLHQAKFYENIEDIEFNLNSSQEWFEALVLGQFERAYDSSNIPEMRSAALALYNLNGGAACTQLFIAKNPIFFDETFNPSLRASKMPLASDAASGYSLANDFADFMDATFARCEKEVQVISQVFVPEMDTMTVFANRVFEDSISEYLNAVLRTAKERETVKVYLSTLASATYCASQFMDFLKNNGKVDVHTESMKESIIELLKPYTEKYIQTELEVMNKKFATEIDKWNKSKDKNKKKAADYLIDQEKAMAHKRAVMQTFKSVIFAPVALTSNLANGTMRLLGGNNKVKPAGTDVNGTGATESTNLTEDDSEATTYHLDDGNLTSLLSLELCLHLLHTNKEALGRALVITYATDQPRTKSNVEKVFVSLLKAIGEQHIRPAFQGAIDRLNKAQPTDAYNTQSHKNAYSDSLQFFELVHLADLISQMVDVYYQEDIKPWIDENDFLSDVFVEKKAFERLLDDHVAAGMDKSVQVLINQCEYILMKEQLPGDYNPSSDQEGKIFDLKPTKACQNVIQCLKVHTQMLTGATDKHTMEVFLGEIGVRLFNGIIKHIKRLQISQTGAMRLICDLNSYNDWACQLRVGQVTKLFSVLKEIGNLFIADGGHELKDFVHDQQKFQGLLRLEEILELLASRTDFKKIQKFVESKDCIIQ